MGFPGEVGGRSPLGRETQVELHSPDRRTGTTIFLDRLNVNRTQDTAAIPQREVAKRIYRSVLLDLGIDEMS
jgi:hypothetical protein